MIFVGALRTHGNFDCFGVVEIRIPWYKSDFRGRPSPMLQPLSILLGPDVARVNTFCQGRMVDRYWKYRDSGLVHQRSVNIFSLLCLQTKVYTFDVSCLSKTPFLPLFVLIEVETFGPEPAQPEPHEAERHGPHVMKRLRIFGVL